MVNRLQCFLSSFYHVMSSLFSTLPPTNEGTTLGQTGMLRRQIYGDRQRHLKMFYLLWQTYENLIYLLKKYVHVEISIIYISKQLVNSRYWNLCWEYPPQEMWTDSCPSHVHQWQIQLGKGEILSRLLKQLFDTPAQWRDSKLVLEQQYQVGYLYQRHHRKIGCGFLQK